MEGKRMRMVVVAGLVALVGCLGWHGPRERARIARGRQMFVDKSCIGCHTLGAIGTPIAPDLSHSGAQHSRSQLEEWLRDPTQYCPSHMPRVNLTEEEIQVLAAYLASLR
jgi:mono/diheme cytochrome c family protein